MFPRVDLSHHCLISFLFFVIFVSTLVKDVSGQKIQAQFNTTMEESDPGIVYLPTDPNQNLLGWEPHTNGGYFGNGTLQICRNDTSCTATVKFTGVAIYYYAPLWPWNISIVLTLDNGDNELVDLRDTSNSKSLLNEVGQAQPTQKFDIRWWKEGLTNQDHTLVISMDGTTSQWAVVDRLVFTSINNSTPTTSPNSIPDASASPSSPTTPHTSSSSKIPLIVGLAFGITGAILLSLLLFLILCKHRSQRTRAYRTSDGNTVVPVNRIHEPQTSIRDGPGLNQQIALGSISPFTAVAPVPVLVGERDSSSAVTGSRSYATTDPLRERTTETGSRSGPYFDQSSGENGNGDRTTPSKMEEVLRNAREEMLASPPPSYSDSHL